MYAEFDMIAKTFVFIGIIMISIGITFYFSSKWPWVGRLPGDIYIHKGDFHFYFPLTTSIIISVIISLLFILLGRRG